MESREADHPPTCVRLYDETGAEYAVPDEDVFRIPDDDGLQGWAVLAPAGIRIREVRMAELPGRTRLTVVSLPPEAYADA